MYRFKYIVSLFPFFACSVIFLVTTCLIAEEEKKKLNHKWDYMKCGVNMFLPALETYSKLWGRRIGLHMSEGLETGVGMPLILIILNQQREMHKLP